LRETTLVISSISDILVTDLGVIVKNLGNKLS